MICPSCASQFTDFQQKFCGNCGSPLNGSFGNTVTTGGGDVHGGIYQAGRDVVFNSTPSSAPVAMYEPVPKWRSPFTQGVLSWLGILVGIAGILPLWFPLRLIGGVVNGERFELTQGYWQLIWMVVAILLLFVVRPAVLRLRHITENQLRKPWCKGWALHGAGQRITLEKILAGKCPICGGKMRYYNKPKEWKEGINSNGYKFRTVTERVPALECKRNPKHWFEVDPAEEHER